MNPHVRPGADALDRYTRMALVRVCVVGSVDDGKSTLLGRLLHDFGAVPDDQLEDLRAASARTRGEGAPPDFAWLSDGLRAEREQGITIDVAYRHLTTNRRRFVIADTPGHEQYTRNMATGSSTADAAMILVDATAGITPQTRRHSVLARLFGIHTQVVVVNKMDLVQFSHAKFQAVVDAFRGSVPGAASAPPQFIPASALLGDNVVRRSEEMPWHEGPTVCEWLDAVELPNRSRAALRFVVQSVIRTSPRTSLVRGQLLSGRIRTGMAVRIFPADLRTRVRSIVTFDGPIATVAAPRSVSLVFEEDLDIGRGDLLAGTQAVPELLSHVRARLVWFGQRPLRTGTLHTLKQAVAATTVRIRGVDSVLDREHLAPGAPREVTASDIAVVDLEAQRPLVVDPYDADRRTGSFLLIDPLTAETVAAGMVAAERPRMAAAKGRPDGGSARVTVWLTGLPAAGKSTLAETLHERLQRFGVPSAVLDGDQIRNGLNRDLSFRPSDRSENVRRIAEVARLFNRNHIHAIVAAVSPFAADRDMARRIIGAEAFLDVYVCTPLSVCIARDPKGHYRRAIAGEIAEFTGISSPYEPPEHPTILLDTSESSVEACVDKLALALARRETHHRDSASPGVSSDPETTRSGDA